MTLLVAYMFLDHSLYKYYSEIRDDDRVRAMNAYDNFMCDLICGKTIAEANRSVVPHEVKRFKGRPDLAHLYVGGYRSAVYIEDEIIVAVASSPYVHEKPECLRRINLSDGRHNEYPNKKVPSKLSN